MVKYGESYITASSTATATAKRSTVKTLGFDIISTAKLRALGYVNYSAIVLDALNLNATVSISPDASKFRAIRQAEANLNGYTNLVLDTRNYVRTSSALTTTAQRELKEAFAQIWRIPNMGIPYIEGHDIQYEITEGYVYNEDMECYSEAKVLYTFHVPHLFESNLNTLGTLDTVGSGVQRITFGQSLLALENGLIAVPFDFDKTSGLVLGEFTISDSTIRIRLYQSVLNSIFGFEGRTNGVFKSTATIQSSFQSNYQIRAIKIPLNNTYSISTTISPTGFRRQISNSNTYATTTGISPTGYRRQISNSNSYASAATISPIGFRAQRSNNNTYATTANFKQVFVDGLDTSFTHTVPVDNFLFANVSLQTVGGVYVYWGDESSGVFVSPSPGQSANISYTYPKAGTYTIRVVDQDTTNNYLSSIIIAQNSSQPSTAKRITSINSFGKKLGTFRLTGSNNFPNLYLTSVPNKIPNTLTSFALEFASIFNDSNIVSWNTQNLTNFALTGCTQFNQPIGSWNTQSLINLADCFYGCISFNQNINSWNISNVTSLFRTFYQCTNFNQPLSNWNTSNVTSMSQTFLQCTNFNQNISSWNTAKVTSMSSMFSGATAFNQPLARSGDSWNTALVTNMVNMFNGASSFDQNISNWCVSLISTKPSGFDTGTLTSWTTAEKPIWGTCP